MGEYRRIGPVDPRVGKIVQGFRRERLGSDGEKICMSYREMAREIMKNLPRDTVTHETIWRWERGRCHPALSLIYHIRDAYHDVPSTDGGRDWRYLFAEVLLRVLE